MAATDTPAILLSETGVRRRRALRILVAILLVAVVLVVVGAVALALGAVGADPMTGT